MSNENSSDNSDWDTMLADWREREVNVRAPREMLAGVERAITRRVSRRRSIRIGAAVAVAVLVIAGIWTSKLSREVDIQPDWTNSNVLLSPTSQITEPCAANTSCLDTSALLARIDLNDIGDHAEMRPSTN